MNMDYKAFWQTHLWKEGMRSHILDLGFIPCTLDVDDHVLMERLKPESTARYYRDRHYAQRLNQEFNEITEREVGARFMPDDVDPPVFFPRIELLLGATERIEENGTPWLLPCIEDVKDARQLIDKIEKIDIVEEMLKGDSKKRYFEYQRNHKQRILLGGFSRGPATIATSLLGAENTCMLMMDDPELMEAFFAALAAHMIGYHKKLMELSDNTAAGFGFADDNCYLFPPNLYERLCAPLLEKIFHEFAPGKNDPRHQHSDSAMGHLMPILREVGINSVNFGPEIHPVDIRKVLPGAIVFGHMPPFLLRNGSEEEIRETVKRDVDALYNGGGMVASTAGSVAAGTPFHNLRVYLAEIKKYSDANQSLKS